MINIKIEDGSQFVNVNVQDDNQIIHVTVEDFAPYSGGGGSGDVVGPGASTDDAIVRWDGITGQLIQDSGVTIDDNNNIRTQGPSPTYSAFRDSDNAGAVLGFVGQANPYLALGAFGIGRVIDRDLSNGNVRLGMLDPLPSETIILSGGTPRLTLNGAGGSLFGTLDMNANNIVSLADPINDQDAATKAYVDANSGGGGSGDVQGPASSTDNAIVRFDGTTGKLVQGSLVLIDDTGNIDMNSNDIVGVGEITMTGNKIEMDFTVGNVFIGANAGNADATVEGLNVAIGRDAFRISTTGTRNVAVGFRALENFGGQGNVAIGSEALEGATNSAVNNVAVGEKAGEQITTANGGVYIGRSAATKLEIGQNNIALGYISLNSAINANNTFALGTACLRNIATTTSNIAIGVNAGRYISDGATNLTIAVQTILIGENTKPSANAESNQIVIGHQAIGKGSNTAVIGNDQMTTMFFGPNANLDMQGNSIINATALQFNTLTAGPTSPTDPGTPGEMKVDDDYIYLCTAPNTWKRAKLNTW